MTFNYPCRTIRYGGCMKDSETFGIEKGWGERAVSWLNEQSGGRIEARLYGETITTVNFGEFEMFSWIGDVQMARRLVLKASKRFRVRVIEGGYKPRERTYGLEKSDYAMVRRGDKIIGHLHFVAPRIGGFWRLKEEERR